MSAPSTRSAPGAELRHGIIGTGFMGRTHAHAIRAAGGVVAAVAGSSPGSAATAAAAMGAQRVTTTDDLVIDRDVDIVHICTPNHLHADAARAALAAGKHVVCEKPLATGVDATHALVEAADRRSLVAAVPFVYRFHPLVRDARARIARGELGRLHLLHGSYLQDWLADPDAGNWRVDPTLGGASRAFADIGVHWCDLVEFVTGHRITSLAADLLTAHDQRGGAAAATEDAATVQFRTDHGAIGSVVISQITPGRKNRLWFSLDGEHGSVAFDQEQPDTLWLGGTDVNRIIPRGVDSAAHPPYDRLPPGHPQGYQDCFTAFVADVRRAVAGDKPDGLPTFDDGHRAAVLTNAVLSAAHSHTWIEVS